jgi:hypothetical protein
MIGIFWVVNFKTRNYFVIFYVYLRLSTGDQEGLFKLVMLNFIFKWSNLRLLTVHTDSRISDKTDKSNLTFQIKLNMLVNRSREELIYV